MIKYLFRCLSTLKFFWYLRHLLPRYKYSNSSKKYEIIFKNIHKIDSIIDFGCANGEKLNFFVKKKQTKYIYGIDLNSHVLKKNNKKFSQKNIIYFKFDNYLTKENLELFYLLSDRKNIDLIIFSRVLYLLNQNEFNKIISLAKLNSKYILIDDFFIFNDKRNIRKRFKLYRATNFSRILKNSFHLEHLSNSPLKNNSNLHNPKIALYRSKNLKNKNI